MAAGLMMDFNVFKISRNSVRCAVVLCMVDPGRNALRESEYWIVIGWDKSYSKQASPDPDRVSLFTLSLTVTLTQTWLMLDSHLTPK